MMLHKNKIWLFFLALVFTFTLIYTVKTVSLLYYYASLSESIESSATAWSVQTVKDESIPLAKYTFYVGGKLYEGETLFYHEASDNPWAIEEALKSLAAKEHKVWYSSKDPLYSSLQKKFPLKECIYTVILWGISIYFFWLGVYVAKLQR